MTMRIAKVPYLNSVVYFHESDLSDRFQVDVQAPRFSAIETSAGNCAAGLIPLAEYLRNKELYRRLGHFGIAVRGRAQSAILFSRVPVQQLENTVIGISEETSTTVRLLRLILDERYHLKNITYSRTWHDDADAVLLIGDEALRMRQDGTQYPFEIDLGMEWWLWQHVPCVFAVWVARADVEEMLRKQIEASIAKSLSLNTTDLEALAEHYASQYDMKPGRVKEYLSAFVYRLGREEEEGIERYEALLKKHQLLEWEPE